MLWTRDPVVWVGAAIGGIAAWIVLFSGTYLPYIDYGNHLGLISVLAHGAESGSLQYLSRSLAPTPYWLFYVLTALLGQLVAVDVAAKLVLGASAAIWVLAGAHLAEATGRDPRVAIPASLGSFGISLGYGFVSFVFAAPLILLVLGSLERLLAATPRQRRARSGALALVTALLFLSHPLAFLAAALMMLLRATLELLIKLSLKEPDTARLALALVVSLLPAGILALLSLGAAGDLHFEPGKSQLLSFSPLGEHAQRLGGSLLERGSDRHWWVMRGVFGLTLLGLLGSWFRPAPSGKPWRARAAMWLYFAYFMAWYWLGPMSITDSLWNVYPRFATLAGVTLVLLPRWNLSGRWGAALALLPLALVGYNAFLNVQHVVEFNRLAKPYDEVRTLIPPRSKVLPLTVVGPDDVASQYQGLTSLYFNHLVDGAAFTPFLFDTPGVPVRARKDVRLPRAPPWNHPDGYDPKTEGVDYDYLVLRGQGLIDRTQRAGLHELVRNVSGWAVFRKKR